MEMSKIVIGAMRFENRETAVATMKRAIDYGFNYIDTAPIYARIDEIDNSESYVGDVKNDPAYSDRVMVSTKCAPGNGGLGFGDFNCEIGLGARQKEQFAQVFAQSQRRMKRENFDHYQLWTTHTMEQFNEAFKPGGWFEGLMEHKAHWKELGITSHADSDTLIKFIESGKFEELTIPYNVVNTTRERALHYCNEQGIRVIAMNPLSGGFLAQNEKLKELALRYLMKLNIHILIGFSTPEQVDYAKWIMDSDKDDRRSAAEIKAEVEEMLGSDEERCTGCGYCAPCPVSINVGASLSHYNGYKYLGIAQAKADFVDRQWEDGLRLDLCTGCGACTKRCPNGLDVVAIIEDAKNILYS